MVIESGVNLRKRKEKARPEEDDSSENDSDDVDKADDTSSICSTSVSETVSRSVELH